MLVCFYWTGLTESTDDAASQLRFSTYPFFSQPLCVRPKLKPTVPMAEACHSCCCLSRDSLVSPRIMG